MDFIYWFFHQFSGESVVEYRTWYASLVKPFFAPPPEVFGIAWSIIYPLIALALVWTLYLVATKRAPMWFVLLLLLNIFLNFTFTPVVIATDGNLLISIVILLVLGTLAWFERYAWRYSKVVFWLLVPYLLWGTFATVLQGTITFLN